MAHIGSNQTGNRNYGGNSTPVNRPMQANALEVQERWNGIKKILFCLETN